MVGRTIRSISFDAKKKARENNKTKFKASSAAERQFFRALKQVARQSGHIVDAYTKGAEITDLKKMTKQLDDYAKLIEPWARRQSAKLLEQVSRSNARAYRNQSKLMGKALQTGVAEQDTGVVAWQLMQEQVALIQSIPLEAGERAQRIAYEAFLSGSRARPDESIVRRFEKERRLAISMHNQMVEESGEGKYWDEEMERTTEVAVNRAKLIARTETARANASFVQARAAAVGAKGYIWRTTMDGAERDSHAEMNGKFVEYTKPPRLSDGTKGHAGTFPNCRCWQDPVLPDIE